MRNLAMKLDQARLRQKDYPGERRAELRLVHDATAAVPCDPMPAAIVSIQEPRQHILARMSTALNKVFAFCLVVVALTAFFWSGAGLGRLTDDAAARQQVAEIEIAPLRAPLQPLGDYDRITGKRK